MHELNKTLSLFGGTALFLNIVIGAGLLVLPGLVYQQVGNLAITSWIICGLAAFPLLLVFVFLGRFYPDAGGISHYALRAFGRFGQRAAALLFLGAVVFGLPSIAMTGGYYVHAVLQGSIHMYAALLILSSALLHGISGNYISRALGFIGSGVIIVLIILLIIGVLGIAKSDTPATSVIPKELDMALLLSPFMMIFFAFTGWEVGSHSAEEFKNPRRDFPLAMILSFIVATAFYAAIALVVQKAHIQTNFEAPFIEITRPILGNHGKYFVSFVAVVLIFANLFGAIWGVSRLVYSLGRDGIIPKFFGTTQDGAPVRAVWLTVAALLCVVLLDYLGLFGIGKMLALAGQNFLLLYGLAAAALFVLARNVLLRLLAVGVVMLALGIVIFAGVHLIYPVALVAIACLVNVFRTKTPHPAPRQTQ